MEQGRIIEIATTIWQQLKASVHYSVLWSWGIQNIHSAEINNQAGLAFDVDGFLFKGSVIVILDEGSDLYNICLMQNGKMSIAREGVFFDELGSAIDALVEKDQCTSSEEYGKTVLSTYGLTQ